MARRTKRRRSGEPSPKEVRRRRRSREQSRTLVFGAAAVIVVIVLVLGFGYYRENIAATRAPVAVVNGKTITTQEYQHRVSYQQFNLVRQFGNQVDQATLVNFLQNQLPQSTLTSMIDQALIEEKATEEGIAVTEEEVQSAIEQQFGFTGEPAPPTAPASDGVTSTTSAGGMTQAEFDTAYSNFLETLNTEAGISESEYREIIREELLRNKVRERIIGDVPATAPQVHARHILVETEEEAQQARQRLLEGEDFATVAEEISTDTASAENGGDLGWFGEGRMVPEFEDVAFSLPVGEISEPVETDFGYHIIEVLERDDNRTLSPSELDQVRQQRFQEWLDEQKAAADIERYWSPDVVPTLPVAQPASQPAQIPPPSTPSQ